MKRSLFALLVLLPALGLVGCAPVDRAKSGAENLPKGWMHLGDRPLHYEMSVDTVATHGGKASARITFIGKKAEGFGTLMQTIKADDYRGKRIRMSAWMKTEDAQSASLWLRIDGAKHNLGFDNMSDRAVTGTTEWTEYALVLDVPEEAVNVSFGAIVAGKGQAWVDDCSIEVVGTVVLSTNRLTHERMRELEVPPDSRVYPTKPVNLDFEG